MTQLRSVRHLRLLALAALLACATGPHAPAPKAAQALEPVRIRVLAINDFHGQISKGRRIDGRPVGSAGVLAAWLRAAEAGMEDRTLIVHGGDLVGASPPTSALLQDEPTVTFFGQLGNRWCQAPAQAGLGSTSSMSSALQGPEERFAAWLDPRCNLAGTTGNHEFDHGWRQLLRLLGGGNHENGPFLESPWRGARYPTLAANVVDARTGQPILPRYVVKEVGGVRIGVVGLVLREAPAMVIPTGVEGLAFLDEAQAANACAEELKQQGVHAIVVLVHQGGVQEGYAGPTRTDGDAPAGRIAGIVRRLDGAVGLVVSAHTHQFTNALLPNAAGRLVLVTQAYSAGAAFAQIDLELSRASGEISRGSAEIRTAWADEGPGRTPDPQAGALEAAAEEKVAPMVKRVVGTAAVALSNQPDAAGETALGDLIADSYRAAIPGAVAAFTNPGGIRTDLGAGPITWGALFAIQPFGNTVVGVTLTGAQLRGVLEQQWRGQATQRMLQLSGIRYVWSESARVGQKVKEVWVGAQPLDPAGRYLVAVNSFLAAGGDRFTALSEVADQVGGPLDMDAMVSHLQALAEPIRPPPGDRIRLVP